MLAFITPIALILPRLLDTALLRKESSLESTSECSPTGTPGTGASDASEPDGRVDGRAEAERREDHSAGDGGAGEEPAVTGAPASEPEEPADRASDGDMDPPDPAPVEPPPGNANGETTPDAVLLERLDDLEARLERRIGGVLEAFNDKLLYDAAKEKHFDRLHRELAEYRSDVLRRASRPLVHGLIGLHGDVGRLVSAWRRKGEEAPLETWLARFGELREDIELLLDDHGVTAYRGDRGEAFDGRLQTVVATVATDDGGRHGTVAESRRPGFEQDERILVRERVAVFELQETTTSESAPPDGAPASKTERED